MNWKFWKTNKQKIIDKLEAGEKPEDIIGEYPDVSKEDLNLDWISGIKISKKLDGLHKQPPTTAQGILCPRCNSNQIRKAGYGNRLECTNCGRIFT